MITFHHRHIFVEIPNVCALVRCESDSECNTASLQGYERLTHRALAVHVRELNRLYHAGIVRVYCVRNGYAGGGDGPDFLLSRGVSLVYTNGPPDPRLNHDQPLVPRPREDD